MHMNPENTGPLGQITDIIKFLFSGSLFYVAVFMATDPVSAPNKPLAQFIYGIIIGSVTIVIRVFSGFPEGTSFGILIGNTFANLLDEISPAPKKKKKKAPAKPPPGSSEIRQPRNSESSLGSEIRQPRSSEGSLGSETHTSDLQACAETCQARRPETGQASKTGRGDNMNTNSLIYTTIFCFIITFAFVFLLALANVGTEVFVLQNQQIAANMAVLNAMNIDYDPSDRNEIFSKFGNVETKTSNDLVYYQSEVNGETIYALQTEGPGLWGIIEVVIGFNEDISRYTGLEIIDQNETPGLGGRIADPWYKAQFQGQAIPSSIFQGEDITLAPTGAGAAENKDDNMIDAITGASRTSESMKIIVSRAARDMRSILGGI